MEMELEGKKKEREELEKVWVGERERLDRVKELKKKLEDAKQELAVALRLGDFEKASQLRFATLPDLEGRLPKEREGQGEEGIGEGGMLHERVTSDDIARVVAKATGIPVTNLLKGERDKLVHVRPPFSSPPPIHTELGLGNRWKIRLGREW